MTTTIMLSYVGTANDRFDREYYCSKHLPQVVDAWKPHGLLSARAFFPATTDEDESGTVPICECIFRDEAAVEAAFGAPRTQDLVADLPNFTDLALTRSRVKVFPL